MKGLFAAVSVIALLAGAPVWAQSAAGSQHPAKPQTAQAKPQAPQALNSQDKAFIKQVGDGNLAEVELGQLALHKATTPAVKEFGRWMMTDHHFANVRLTAITKKIGATGFQPKLNLLDQQLQHKLQGLSGGQFDRQYTQAMVRTHRTTIPKFRKEAQDGQNPLLKTYAHNLLPVLNQHLAEAKRLAAISQNTAAASKTAKGMGAPPATTSPNAANAGGAAGMGAPPAALSGSSSGPGYSGAAAGMGAPPGATSRSPSNDTNNPTNFYNR